MGCWNATCGITGLPIRADDEVVAFPVGYYRGETYCQGFYEPTDYGAPMSLPIYGKYNDYGGVEEVQESYVTEGLKVFWGYNSLEDLLDAFQDGIEYHFFGYDRKKIFDVGLWMMHRSVFEKFKKIKSEGWTGDADPYDKVISGADDFFDSLESERDILKKYVQGVLNESNSEDFILTRLKFSFPEYSYNEFASMISSSSSCDIFEEGYKYYLPYIYNRLAEGATKESDDLKQMIEDVAGVYCLIRCMSRLRKGFAPSPGLGSQGEYYPEYRMLLSSMDEIISKEEENIERIRKEEEWENES